MTDHAPLPVAGYNAQSDAKIAQVNNNKVQEEKLLRVLDELGKNGEIGQRWLSIARTHFEEGFMAFNRAIFRPSRVRPDEYPPQPGY